MTENVRDPIRGQGRFTFWRETLDEIYNPKVDSGEMQAVSECTFYWIMVNFFVNLLTTDYLYILA